MGLDRMVIHDTAERSPLHFFKGQGLMRCPAVDADGVLKTSGFVCVYLKTICNPQVHCVFHYDL